MPRNPWAPPRREAKDQWSGCNVKRNVFGCAEFTEFTGFLHVFTVVYWVFTIVY